MRPTSPQREQQQRQFRCGAPLQRQLSNSKTVALSTACSDGELDALKKLGSVLAAQCATVDKLASILPPIAPVESQMLCNTQGKVLSAEELSVLGKTSCGVTIRAIPLCATMQDLATVRGNLAHAMLGIKDADKAVMAHGPWANSMLAEFQ